MEGRGAFVPGSRNHRGIFIYDTGPCPAVECPVCGFGSEDRVCGRCGTDLDALEGANGEPRLEIRPMQKSRPHPGSLRAS